MDSRGGPALPARRASHQVQQPKNFSGDLRMPLRHGSAAALLLACSAVLAAQPQAAPTPQQLDAIWRDFIQHDHQGAQQARSGMRVLLGAPKLAVPFLQARLKPAPVIDAKKIDQAIADLDSASFQTREKAAATLEALGPAAAGAMEKKLALNPSLEVRQRLETLLQLADDKAMTAEELRGVRAIEVLEGIGSPEARTVLQALARGGDGSIITEQARAALGRLQRRTP